VPPIVTVPTLIKPAHTPSTSVNTHTMVNITHLPLPNPALTGCPVGVALLHKFHTHVGALPPDVGEADLNHPLAVFSGDPVGCVGEDEDVWEKFDGPLNTLLQQPPEKLQDLVWVGERGLIRLCHLLEYLVMHHQLSGGMLLRMMDLIRKIKTKMVFIWMERWQMTMLEVIPEM